MLALRREMQIVFQDPLSSLNPRMSSATRSPSRSASHGIGDKVDRFDRAREFLEVVGLSTDYYDRLPHEFSGGQNQRVAIARALILQPKLLILDEPVSALDVSIRAQILRLLIDLQGRFQLTYVFISHDLSVVKRFCNRTAVLYLGRIVEIAESESLYHEPLHPYSQALISAIPEANPDGPRAESLGGLEATCRARSARPPAAPSTPAAPTACPSAPKSAPSSRKSAPATRSRAFCIEGARGVGDAHAAPNRRRFGPVSAGVQAQKMPLAFCSSRT